MPTKDNIRNITIIAHVDHGKTTLVDAFLKQSNTFSDREDPGELIMDTNPLEREKGITILAKNVSIDHKGVKINVIDTPGHADFSGEVERVMNMADGCILLVDAVDGPMPQTRYVLQQAINYSLSPIVVINKIDRPESRISAVVNEVEELFLELATDDSQLNYPVFFASAKAGYAIESVDDEPESIAPILDSIVQTIPSPTGSLDGGFQLLVTALDYDDYAGQIAIGKIFRGSVSQKDSVLLINADGVEINHKVEQLFVYQGMKKKKVESASVGEIIALTGLDNVTIGNTICSVTDPDPLPIIKIDEPTVKMLFGANTSPLMGKEGKFCTSRELYRRLTNELKTDVGLRLSKTDNPDQFDVSGRGELHLSILAETMRREGYEFQVSQPEPIIKNIDGKKHEPYETLMIETNKDFYGILTDDLTRRLGVLIDVLNTDSETIKMRFSIPTRGLIGFRSFFQNATHGDGIITSRFESYNPLKGEIRKSSHGFLIASEPGDAVAYGLINAQERGKTLIGPGTKVYEGMIVGVNSRSSDLVVNVCKEKKLTNMRSSTADIGTQLVRPLVYSLEEALDIISQDEFLEITPKNLRLRKKLLAANARKREDRNRN
ncbi:MAG: translational GTPase TypA [SAR202 cluster bacterium]|nr:translational GTPase TypA [Chloroflexota bacterium]MQG22029.1 translational GTPase TypA [SAR202 cluster bacterium]|tara:strand:+ start:2988 stop:4808 length:1821 start_codon:yes stop_codon:yes gene_type:complete